ncbi:MAG: hypothetical protein HZA54_08925 [Planctomycetes bacterium]|nr:hypothetical protein [Planctomycetota bacterium]
MNRTPHVVVLAALVCCLVAVPAARAAGLEWEPAIDPDGQIFPALIVATATLRGAAEEPEAHAIGDARGLMSVRVKAPAAGAAFKLTIRCDRILKPSTLEGVLPEAGEVYTLSPKLLYNYEALLDQCQLMPADVTFELAVGGASEQKTLTATLRTINDCPYSYVGASGDEDEGEEIDLNFMFAAYVNENHPLIDKLLKEALATKAVSSFSGYQEKDPKAVYAQVYSIWRVLQQRGVKYSSITETGAHSERVYSQHVRFLDESVGNAQANCVDGSVLFAAALRKIGIDAALVLVPGHCFLAFDLDEEGEEIMGLETTMLGAEDPGGGEEEDEDEPLSDVAEEGLDAASARTFDAAIDVGTEALRRDREKFDSDREPEYQIIRIGEARARGILPLAYRAPSGGK